MIRRLTPIAIAALLIAGCSSGGSNSGGDSPHPLGTTADIGGWNVTVQSANLDASREMQAADPINPASPEGESYVLLHLDLEYLDGQPTEPYHGAVMAIIGGDGIEYSTMSCGLHPDSLTNVGDMYPGATVSGIRCFQVPDEAVEGAKLRVQDGWSGSRHTYFAIQ